mmetsp:Transcript_29909/g.69000  ORF Transcript_29909/g.69000 Transcript_29909/m.69000 type:complete len:103 (+) Transcript_29909:756-1064(+)
MADVSIDAPLLPSLEHNTNDPTQNTQPKDASRKVADLPNHGVPIFTYILPITFLKHFLSVPRLEAALCPRLQAGFGCTEQRCRGQSSFEERKAAGIDQGSPP